MPSDADKCRSALRKRFKEHLGILRGGSSPAVEGDIKSLACCAFHKLSPEEVQVLIRGVAPAWLDEVALDFFCRQSELPEGRTLKMDGTPVEAADGGEDSEPTVQVRKRAAKDFDYFCYLEKDSLQKKADKLKTLKTHAGKSAASLLKIAGGMAWRKFQPDDKKAYRIQRERDWQYLRVRGEDGRYHRKETEISADDLAAVAQPLPVDADAACATTRQPLSKGVAAALGHALVEELVIELQKKGTPEKQFAEQLLTRATANNPETIRHLKKSGVIFRRTVQTLGRPVGTPAVTDAQLIDRLNAVSSESSTIHTKLETPVKTLESSKRRCTEVAGLKKSQLCKRLRLCRLGFAEGRTQRGRCDPCEAWKNTGRKKVQHLLDDYMSQLRGTLDAYFADWDDIARIEYLDEYELPGCDNPDYIEGLLEYLRDHEHTYATEREALPDADRLALATVEFLFIEALEGSLEDVQNMAWHLTLKATVDRLWKECWYHPSALILYGLWDHMALLTLPRGPNESTQSWYANARLGVYICTAILWGAGVGSPRIHFFVGRCKEKSGPYSMYIWKHIMENLVDLGPVQDICWWSDGGRHFRGTLPISTMAVNGISYLCQKSRHTAHQHTVDLNFGIPSHFKNQCDGAQAQARGILDEVAKKETVSTVPAFIEASRRLYEEYVGDKTRAPRMAATWHDFFPTTERKDFVHDFCKQFKSPSFKEQVSVCQSWSCKLNDVRRRATPLYENERKVLTALDFKASMLRDGSRVPSDRCCHPELLPAVVDGAEAAAVDGEADEAEDVAQLGAEFEGVFGQEGDAEIALGKTLHLGWQCSYRASEPEKKQFSAWRKRFSKMRKKWEGSGLRLTKPRSKRPISEQLAIQQGWKQNRKARKP